MMRPDLDWLAKGIGVVLLGAVCVILFAELEKTPAQRRAAAEKYGMRLRCSELRKGQGQWAASENSAERRELDLNCGVRGL